MLFPLSYRAKVAEMAVVPAEAGESLPRPDAPEEDNGVNHTVDFVVG
jgi:hypothetical protein